jgi:hypothetical protein
MDHDKENTFVTKQIDNVVSDKNRIEVIKKNLIVQSDQKEDENQELDQKIDEQKQLRTEKLLELDKVMLEFEQKQRDRVTWT